MMKRLVYFGAACILFFGLFQAFLVYHKWERQRPVVYIDNYSGTDVELSKSGAKWMDIPNGQSKVIKDLKTSNVEFYAKKLDTGRIDTFQVDIQKGGTYMINLFGGMQYYIGEIVYAEQQEEQALELPEGQIISDRVFQISADFIFETPPVQIQKYTSSKKLDYHNVKIKKTFIRRMANKVSDVANIDALTDTQEYQGLGKEKTGKNKALTNSPKASPSVENQSDTKDGDQKAISKNILSFIRAGDTGQAIDQLASLNPGRSAELKDRFDEFQKSYRAGLMSFEDWLIAQNKIDLILFDVLAIKHSDKKKVSVDRIKGLLASGDMTSAIDILVESGFTDAILVAGSLAKVKKEYHKGTITEGTFNSFRKRKEMALLNMLE